VTVIMKKPVASLDFSFSGLTQGASLTKETVLYDGATREICAKFPRNVNTHAAVALAGIGFDRTRSILIADPTLASSTLEIKASGPGVSMHLTRTNELRGVSGVMTFRAALGSLLRTVSKKQPMVIC
jgi:aspartate dehydrogenase